MTGQGKVAVVLSSPGDCLEAQTLPPAAVYAGSDSLGAAAVSDAEWIWLLGPGVWPEPESLELLLEGAQPPGEPAASIVAGMLVGPTGVPIEKELPAPAYTNQDAAVRLIERRLLPIRAASLRHCLVRRECFGCFGVPDISRYGRYAPVAWTGRVLRERHGYFAPLSRAASSLVPDRLSGVGGLGDVRAAVRTAATGAWTPGEIIRELAGIAADSLSPQARR